MSRPVAIVSNVHDYAGPPAVAALLGAGMTVVCHDAGFADEAARTAFEAAQPGALASAAGTPEAVVADALARFGRIDAVVSNDAGDVIRGSFLDRDADDYRTLLERLTIAPFRLARAALPTMTAAGQGRLLFITSGAPLRPRPDLVLYSAARAATNALVKALAAEVAPAGVAVNAIAPIFLESNYFPAGMADPALAAAVRETIPMRRMGAPEEIGRLIVALASGGMDFVSGQIIAFSGAAT